MATISKFYLHDAVSPNTGTMPSGAIQSGGTNDGNATGATTARDATGTIGTSQVAASYASLANTNVQRFGIRRFVTRPLAAQTIDLGAIPTGTTMSIAANEGNGAHNGAIQCYIYCWRPSTGAQVGSIMLSGNASAFTTTEPGTTQTALNDMNNFGATPVTCQDGDILVFDFSDLFTQSMATAYTENFYYDGTTEASTSSCASFISVPNPITLFTPPAATSLVIPSRVIHNSLLRR